MNKTEVNKSLVVDYIEKHISRFNSLLDDSFAQDVYTPAHQQWAAAAFDEAQMLGIGMNGLAQVMRDVEGTDAGEIIKRFQVLACLHPDSLQAGRLASYKNESSIFSSFFGLKLDIRKVDFSAICENESALKHADYLFGFTDQEWINYIVSHDDTTLMYTRCIETNALKESEVIASLKENPRIRKMLYGTANHQLKDLADACVMPFQSDFQNTQFASKFDPNVPTEILSKHGDLILAGCFRHAYSPKRMGAALDAAPGQEEAIMQVLELFQKAGVHWYKPWCASRVEMYPMALMDLEGEIFSDRGIARAFVTDNRNFEIATGTIKYVCRRSLIKLMPVDALIDIYKNESTGEEMMGFFYRETGNTIFLNHLKDSAAKRHILSDELGL